MLFCVKSIAARRIHLHQTEQLRLRIESEEDAQASAIGFSHTLWSVLRFVPVLHRAGMCRLWDCGPRRLLDLRLLPWRKASAILRRVHRFSMRTADQEHRFASGLAP